MRYRYSTISDPPAPFVNAAIGNPLDFTTTEEEPALVDTGADQTVVPLTIARQLRIESLRQVYVSSLDSELRLTPTYVVKIDIADLPPVYVEALGGDDSYVLLGRDVLNRLRIVLDGPNQILEIG